MLFLSGIVSILALLTVLFQQSSPTVEVILSTEQAKQGDVIYADVIIRNGTAIAGADIGITTDGTCLRITDRQPGDYLPVASENGGFIVFQELSDSGTRMAVTITDRTKIGTGDGLFYRAEMQVACNEGTSSVDVSFAELAALKDPTGSSDELIGYTLDSKTLATTSDTLSASPNAVAATPIPLEDASNSYHRGGGTELLSGYIVLGVAVVLVLVTVIAIFAVRRRRRSTAEAD
jgi:hypothetical protein